jgi:endonuclease/exonuclease/phosphatase family metal-dependent hydrolase
MGPCVTLATFNVHAGVDGWGRPFDVIKECDLLDVDVLVMQESWAPDGGGPSTAADVAARLGYDVIEEGLAHGRLYGPDPQADDRWGPRFGYAHDSLHLDHASGLRTTASHRKRPFTAGSWGVAVLSRVPVTESTIVSLGSLPRDPARRVAVTCAVSVAGRPLTIVGTHMSHLLQGSPIQYRRLHRSLPTPDSAAVLAGDMNLWGPAVSLALPGWRSAAKGRSWPAHRPHSQLDHVLVTPPVTVTGSEVVRPTESDHCPVRVTLELP